jgi:5-formyltetrahydrofolate cyclo-ligase
MERTFVIQSKQLLRHTVKARLSSLPPEQFPAEGLQAATLIQTLPVWSQYDTVLLFLSMGPSGPPNADREIDTRPLLEAAFRAGKKIFVPKVEGDDLAFYRIVSPDGPWVTGPYGIREPVTDGGRLSPADFPALIIVPGLAFDRSGRRLGRGKGYYDRFFAELDAAGRARGMDGRSYAALGLCMAAQIVPKVPAEGWDKKMDGVISSDFAVYQ